MDSNTTKLLRTHLNSHKINNCVYTNFSAILSFCHNFLANCDTLTGQAIKGQFTGLQVYLVYLKAPIVFQMINAYFYGASREAHLICWPWVWDTWWWRSSRWQLFRKNYLQNLTEIHYKDNMFLYTWYTIYIHYTYQVYI